MIMNSWRFITSITEERQEYSRSNELQIVFTLLKHAKVFLTLESLQLQFTYFQMASLLSSFWAQLKCYHLKNMFLDYSIKGSFFLYTLLQPLGHFLLSIYHKFNYFIYLFTYFFVQLPSQKKSVKCRYVVPMGTSQSRAIWQVIVHFELKVREMLDTEFSAYEL